MPIVSSNRSPASISNSSSRGMLSIAACSARPACDSLGNPARSSTESTFSRSSGVPAALSR